MHGEHEHHDGGDAKGFHGMVLWGLDGIYLSHLPMFKAPPHAYQVIIDAELAHAAGGPATEYATDRTQHPGQLLYSLAPEDFVLPDILPQAGRPARLSTLRGALFRNRFDQDNGEEIAPDVVVNIKNIIHGRKFDPAAAELKSLEYIAFGKPSEIYLAHLITRPPDFDHIVRVTLDNMPAEESLRRGMILTIPALRNDKEERPTTDRSVSATLGGVDGDQKAVEVTVVEEVFFNDDPNDLDI
jgi:hypothetical protein